MSGMNGCIQQSTDGEDISYSRLTGFDALLIDPVVYCWLVVLGLTAL